LKFLNNIVVGFVILILAFIIIPAVPSFSFDMMFILNLTLSLIILLKATKIQQKILWSFPIIPHRMLLITTLFSCWD
jgi:flagellar biosynthesis component FlhA